MRILVGGLILLVVAAMLPSWEVPDVPAPETMRAHPSVPRAKESGARGFEGQRPGIADSVATPAKSAKLIASSSDPAARPTSVEAKQVVEGSPARLREATPGSTSISEAIASIIGSDRSEDAAAPVARLYFAYFNRAPDFEGFNYYIDEREGDRPLDAIAEEFAGSREFEARYGLVDNAAFIDRVYQNVLGGPADASQRAYWLELLESGRMSRGELMLAFSESTTFRAQAGDEVFVTMAYAETLRRAPEPTELLHWVSFLDAGNPRVAVIEGLLATPPRR